MALRKEVPVTVAPEVTPKTGLLNYNMYGLPIWAWFFGALILAFGQLTKSYPVSFAGDILVLFVVGFFFGKVGDTLPIWKDYLGGGSLLAFLGASYLVSTGVISTD